MKMIKFMDALIKHAKDNDMNIQYISMSIGYSETLGAEIAESAGLSKGTIIEGVKSYLDVPIRIHDVDNIKATFKP
jgi:hypothetical protein